MGEGYIMTISMAMIHLTTDTITILFVITTEMLELIRTMMAISTLIMAMETMETLSLITIEITAILEAMAIPETDLTMALLAVGSPRWIETETTKLTLSVRTP
jgi:hypothetical protein